MTAIQRAILQALRFGKLNQFEIAEAVDQPPFRIRAELQALRRDRFVTARHGRTELEWALTEQGHALVWSPQQERLFR